MMNKTQTTGMILVAVILMDILTGMEFDLFVPSFAELQSHFHLTPSWVEALLSVNFIGYCLSLFFVGSLADRYGRKPIVLAGLSIFVIGSLFCLSTTSYYFLMMGRFFQGIGIAAPTLISFLIIADFFPLKKQQFLMAMLNGSMNIAVGVSPVVGSYVALYFHWQGNFFLLLILGIMTLMVSAIFVPTYQLPSRPTSFSLRDYLPLFQSKPLMLLVVSLVCMIVPYWIFVGISPLLYVKDLRVSLSHFGYYQGIFALVFALGSILYGLMIKNRESNTQKMVYVTISIFTLSIVTITLVTLWHSANPLLITLSFLPFIIGQIIPSTLLYPLCLNFVPGAKGRISALIQGGKLIFSSIGLQIAGFFYHGSFQEVSVIIIMFIIMAIVTLFFVIKHRQILIQTIFI